MKCPKCNGKGKILDYIAERNCHGEWETVLREIPCDKCQREPMTNEEWLRSATTDELAYILRDTYLLGYTHGHNGTDIHGGWSEWLKEKHNDL